MSPATMSLVMGLLIAFRLGWACSEIEDGGPKLEIAVRLVSILMICYALLLIVVHVFSALGHPLP